MDSIDKKDMDEAKVEAKPELIAELNTETAQAEFDKMMGEFDSPVQKWKEVAVKIKAFLDRRIENEMADKGLLSDHTRRWVETYNETLEKIQKALYGDKSVNLHVHTVTHSDIAMKIRNAKKVTQ
jgi:hypothetical protein